MVERHLALRAENAELREKLADREARVHALDDQLREINQRRQDATKRIDELIRQVERLDASFGAPAE